MTNWQTKGLNAQTTFLPDLWPEYIIYTHVKAFYIHSNIACKGLFFKTYSLLITPQRASPQDKLHKWLCMLRTMGKGICLENPLPSHAFF